MNSSWFKKPNPKQLYLQISYKECDLKHRDFNINLLSDVIDFHISRKFGEDAASLECVPFSDKLGFVLSWLFQDLSCLYNAIHSCP